MMKGRKPQNMNPKFRKSNQLGADLRERLELSAKVSLITNMLMIGLCHIGNHLNNNRKQRKRVMEMAMVGGSPPKRMSHLLSQLLKIREGLKAKLVEESLLTFSLLQLSTVAGLPRPFSLICRQ